MVVADLEVARSYRKALESKVLCEGVPTVSRTSTSHVDVLRAANLAEAALRSVNRISDEIDVQSCQASLTCYLDELDRQTESLARITMDPIDAEEVKLFEGIELDDERGLIDWLLNRRSRTVDSMDNDDWETYTDDDTGVKYFHSHRSKRSTWTDPNVSPAPDVEESTTRGGTAGGKPKVRNTRGSTLGATLSSGGKRLRSKVLKSRHERLVRERVLLGSLPTETICEYVCEQRLINGAFSHAWQRTLFRTFLQQHRLPQTARASRKRYNTSKVAHNSSTYGRIVSLAMCCLYCLATSSYVFGFHVHQESKRGADANHAVYAAAILDTSIELLIVSPFGLLIKLIIFPSLVRLLLKRNTEAYFVTQHATALRNSMEADQGGWSAKALVGVVKARRKFKALLDQANARSSAVSEQANAQSSEGVEDSEAIGSPIHDDDGTPEQHAPAHDPAASDDGGAEWESHVDAATGETYHYSQSQRRSTWTSPWPAPHPRSPAAGTFSVTKVVNVVMPLLSLAPSDAHQVLIHQLLRTSRSSRCLRSTETTCPTIITVVMPTPTQCTALAMGPLRLLYALKRRSQTRPSSSDSSTVLHRPFVVTMNETQTRPRCASSKRGQWHSRRCSPHNRTRHLHPRHRAAAP